MEGESGQVAWLREETPAANPVCEYDWMPLPMSLYWLAHNPHGRRLIGEPMLKIALAAGCLGELMLCRRIVLHEDVARVVAPQTCPPTDRVSQAVHQKILTGELGYDLADWLSELSGDALSWVTTALWQADQIEPAPVSAATSLQRWFGPPAAEYVPVNQRIAEQTTVILSSRIHRRGQWSELQDSDRVLVGIALAAGLRRPLMLDYAEPDVRAYAKQAVSGLSPPWQRLLGLLVAEAEAAIGRAVMAPRHR